MGTCSACLDGLHRRCERGACACSICRVQRPSKPKPAPKPKKPRAEAKPRKPGARAGPQPWTEAEKDQIAADILRLLQVIRLRQIQETAGYELRREMREMALARADAVLDTWLESVVES